MCHASFHSLHTIPLMVDKAPLAHVELICMNIKAGVFNVEVQATCSY